MGRICGHGRRVSAAPSLPDEGRPTLARRAPLLTGPALTDLALARTEVDRSAHRRTDDGWLNVSWADPRTRVLVVEHGRVLCDMGSELVRLVFVTAEQAPGGVRFLLGVDHDGAPYFGVAGPLPEPRRETVRPVPLREAGPLLSDRDAGLMTHAVALGNWHETFTHCPRCGSPTDPILSGHARKCPVEAGESAEQAVAREVHEETSITVGRVTYLGSQPWPMPQSLMLGFRADAAGSTEIRVDDDEIAEAHWYSRADLRRAVEGGDLLLPPVSIAHRIIESWYGGPLPGS